MNVTFCVFQFQLSIPILDILDTLVQNCSGVALSLCERYSDPPSDTDGTTTKPYFRDFGDRLSITIPFYICVHLCHLRIHSGILDI